jgi:hypothetical protein
MQVLDGDVRRGLTDRVAGRRDSTPGSAPGGSATAGIADEATDSMLEALPAGLRLLDVVELSLEAVRAGVVRHSLAAHPPDMLITVPRSACRTLDFHKAGEMIALGRRLAVEALDREEEPAPVRAVDGWSPGSRLPPPEASGPGELPVTRRGPAAALTAAAVCPCSGSPLGHKLTSEIQRVRDLGVVTTSSPG